MHTKHRLLLPLFFALAFVSGGLQAQTINWGSAVFSELVDSSGNTLDDTFVFELGSFVNNFTPNDSNTEDWMANWQVFDVAAYNGVDEVDDDGIFGYFTSSVHMNASGTSDSVALSPAAISFEGLDAYMWVENTDVIKDGTEWMLTRDTSWVFPNADSDCCGNALPIEWSTSDLKSATALVWGTHGGMKGGGLVSHTGSFAIQTATFAPVPEPSQLLLSGIAAMLFTLRRKR